MTWIESGKIKFSLINAENLFLLFDVPFQKDFLKLDEIQWQKLSTSIYDNKPLKKTKELAAALLDINADILMLCEVGGLESLKNFNEHFLNNAYSPVLIEGNSDRNIDVGFLIKKEQPYYFDILSNKNRPINYLYPHERALSTEDQQLALQSSSHKFSRDVVELRLFQKDREKPFIIILLTHLKSRLDPDKIDPNGFERRRAELLTLVDIYNELETKHQKTPIVVCGDFNGNASAQDTDEEFKAIYEKTALKDVFEITGLSKEERATYYQVKSGSRTEGRQIDFCFLPPQLHPLINKKQSLVYRYKNHLGLPHDIPYNLDAKLNLPSDHYPIIFELENLKFW